MARVTRQGREKIRRYFEKRIIKSVQIAKRQAPVDTGRLRSSITYVEEEGVFKVGSNVEYAPFVEFGTEDRAPQPYLRPAVRQAFNQYVEFDGD